LPRQAKALLAMTQDAEALKHAIFYSICIIFLFTNLKKISFGV